MTSILPIEVEEANDASHELLRALDPWNFQ